VSVIVGSEAGWTEPMYVCTGQLMSHKILNWLQTGTIVLQNMYCRVIEWDSAVPTYGSMYRSFDVTHKIKLVADISIVLQNMYCRVLVLLNGITVRWCQIVVSRDTVITVEYVPFSALFIWGFSIPATVFHHTDVPTPRFLH
jgi:hypothetical protein